MWFKNLIIKYLPKLSTEKKTETALKINQNHAERRSEWFWEFSIRVRCLVLELDKEIKLRRSWRYNGFLFLFLITKHAPNSYRVQPVQPSWAGWTRVGPRRVFILHNEGNKTDLRVTSLSKPSHERKINVTCQDRQVPPVVTESRIHFIRNRNIAPKLQVPDVQMCIFKYTNDDRIAHITQPTG